MTRYPRYKNSGVYYLCPLPERWELKRAKTLFRQEKRAVRPDDGVVTCFRDGQVTLRTNRRVEGFTNSLKEIGYQGVRKGDLVIHNMDAFAGSVGVSESDGKMSPVCSICTPIRADVNVTYFALMLRVLAKTGFIKSLAKGIRERSTDFRYSDFKDLLLPLPPLPEQEAIVRYLDETTGKIDKAIAAEERLIELLQERKQIIINETVTRGLESNAKLRPSGVAWLGDIPEGWDVRKIFVVFEENTEKNNSFVIRHAMKFNYGKLIDKNEDFDVDAMRGVYSKYTLIRQDDIVINGLNLNYDMVSQRVAIAPKNGIITSAYITIRPRNYVCPNYYCYLFKGMDSKKIFHGMGCGIRLTLSFKDLKNQLIPLPPLHEQEAIVKYLDEETGKIDRAIEVKRRQIALLRERREIIIDEVVTGKVKVA